MSDILCSAASWLGVDWDRCKHSTVAIKIGTPVGAGCASGEGTDEPGEIGPIQPWGDVVVEVRAEEDHPIVCQDNDGDGYGIGPDCPAEDCDDAKPDIYPGAEEICDGIDNDCDGNRNCLANVPEEIKLKYDAESCFVDPQILKNEKVVAFDPKKVTDWHDLDTFSDSDTTYRQRFCDGPECKGAWQGVCWDDQYGLGEYAKGGALETNFCQLGNEYNKDILLNAKSVQMILGDVVGGRQLATFIVDGQLLPCLEVREGLAYENVTHYYEGQIPPLLAQLVQEAGKFAKPNFLEPWIYKGQAQSCQN